MLKCHLVKLWGFKILELFSDYPFLCAQTNLWFMLKLRLKVGLSPDSLQQSWCCCPPWWLTCHWLDNTPSWTCYNPGSGKRWQLHLAKGLQSCCPDLHPGYEGQWRQWQCQCPPHYDQYGWTHSGQERCHNWSHLSEMLALVTQNGDGDFSKFHWITSWYDGGCFLVLQWVKIFRKILIFFSNVFRTL